MESMTSYLFRYKGRGSLKKFMDQTYTKIPSVFSDWICLIN